MGEEGEESLIDGHRPGVGKYFGGSPSGLAEKSSVSLSTATLRRLAQGVIRLILLNTE